MRTEEEEAEFEIKARQFYISRCGVCHGTDKNCACYKRMEIAVQSYVACIPFDFIGIRPENIRKNSNAFKNVIAKYVARLDAALRGGYGLTLLGDNGVGKSYFISYVLYQAIKKGMTAYYTTALSLEHNMHVGFSDIKIRRRLDYMLTSDFLAIDEIGKEHRGNKGDRTFMDTQLERILKQRCDDAMPVLLATNLSQEALFRSYGSSIGSMLMGKTKFVALKSGDFRLRLSKRMDKDMNYGIR